MTALIVLFLHTSLLFGATLEGQFLRAISHAKTAADVEHLRAGYEQIKVAQMACGIQMREHMVPAACYEALELEVRSGSRGASEKAEALRKLDSLCISAAEKLRVQVEDGPALSRTCAEKVAEARTIMKYREEWSEN